MNKFFKAKIHLINENPENPRIIKDEKFKKLVKSIQDFPEMLELRPIVVNKEMMVLGGNMRLKACKQAGLKEIPVLITELPEHQQKEFIIKDNLGYGEWDYDILSNNWEIDLLTDWGVDLPKITETIENELDIKDEKENLIIIECISEYEQKNLFEELEQRGFKCKLME